MVKSSSRLRKKRWFLAGEWALAGAFAVILLVFMASTLDGIVVRNGGQAAVITAVLLDLANTDRANAHVPELTVSPTLTAIAQAKANDMAQKGYFAHKTPDGHDPWYWFALGGYKFSYAGENLAIDFSDSADVEVAWMNSPTHRANLLNSHFKEVGIATAVGTYEGHTTIFVAQEFGTPSSLPPASISAPIATSTVPTSPTELATATTVTKPAVETAGKPAPPTSEVLGAEKTTKVAQAAKAATQAPVAPTPTIASPLPAQAYNPKGLEALWNVFAASPKSTLRFAYYLFGILILLALVVETGLEFKKHHVRHMLATLALIAVMGGLFLIADGLVFTTPHIVEQGGASTGSV